MICYSCGADTPLSGTGVVKFSCIGCGMPQTCSPADKVVIKPDDTPKSFACDCGKVYTMKAHLVNHQRRCNV